ncbi:MAG: lipid-A-disaccharide synthase [Bacteroidetes bacterium ADurb.BinA174]|jgi:lipid-A-disaccharide synthase-like uncharacterized protein|nr:MAG: lipid-A-disaccharide synthase [Bacteroidetes bacterium ADurb.BinA174]
MRLKKIDKQLPIFNLCQATINLTQSKTKNNLLHIHRLNMQGSPAWIYAIGFLAQAFFSARLLYQWVVTEKAKRVLSPSAFWILSIFGSYLLFIYGVFRNDFAIILGQFISYYIYLWNLNMKGLWKKLPVVLKTVLLITPLAAAVFLMRDISTFTATFFQNKNIPVWLLIFGSAGQVLFTLRFIYQWIYSRQLRESTLPIGFWVISLLGSASIIAYGIFRLDPVLILGQSFGFVAYIRNIMIYYSSKKQLSDEK